MQSSSHVFDAWLDGFFEFYFRRHPVDATFIGEHRYDHTLPDFSAEGNRIAGFEMAGLLEDLAGVPRDDLSEAQRHDLRLAQGFLEIQAWENTAPNFHCGNPSLYTGEAIFSILSLFHRDAEPVSERAQAAIARMFLIPDFLAVSREIVTAAPVPWTERAIRESRSGIAFFGRGIEILATERGFDSEELRTAAAGATSGFETHLEWLESYLLVHPASQVASGRDALDRYLLKGHALSPEKNSAWVGEYAAAELAKAQAELVLQAHSIDPERSAAELLTTLGDLHPSIDEYYGEYRRVWEEARRAALDADLVTWPDFPIEYIPFPKSDREAAGGLYYLYYRCPAPYGRTETHKYRVTPIEPSMPVEQQERLLRATNSAVIKLNHVVHHGGIGHHVQNWNGFRAESRIGRMAGTDGASRIAMFCAGTLVEGWACYTVDLMNEVGYLTPLESLSEKQGRVRMVARAMADVGIHTGAMTIEDAAEFYQREALMTPDAAKSEAVKNSMFPGAALMYLIGTDAIVDLRETLKGREGDAFSLKAFHDRLLSYGAIPVSLIAESMLSQA
ncbi:DUF885 domain-containing protein [soil metagenome]